jgi:hypothetical protein
MAKAVAKHIFELMHPQQRSAPAPVREPPPPKPLPHTKYPAGSQQWFKLLPEPPSLQDEISAGRVI